MDLQAHLGAERRGIDHAPQLGGMLGAFRLAVGADVQFDHRRAKCLGDVQLHGCRIDEQRHPAAGPAQPLDKGGNLLVQRGHVQAAFGGQLLALLRHQADRMRGVPERDLEHLLGRRHFQIERQVDLIAQSLDVEIGNMSPIFAQMRGDAVGAGVRRQSGRPHRILMLAAAGISDGRDMVDIDPQPQSVDS